jgi:hypothetical protein
MIDGLMRAAGPPARLPAAFGGGRWEQTPPGAAVEELLLDFQDYLRQNGLSLWAKDHPKSRRVRALCYQENRSYSTPDQVRGRLCKPYIGAPANALVCLIHQANYLLVIDYETTLPDRDRRRWPRPAVAGT